MPKLIPRKSDRVRHLREVSFVTSSEPQPRKGNTIDLSLNGVKLYATLTPRIGETIDLTWNHRVRPITLSGRVVYVRGDDYGTCAGVAFHHQMDNGVFRELCSAK